MVVEKEMNCLAVCRLLGADPNSDNDAIKNHLLTCNPCAAYAEQQSKLTDSMEQAINIPVPEGLVSRILLQQGINQKKQQNFHLHRFYAIAASVLLTVAVIAGLLFINSPVDLAKVALNHVKGELKHLHENNNVQLVKLNSLLQPFNMKLNSSLGEISYAGSCKIKNSVGVHIVVQTETGPVTILLMPGEHLKNRKLVDDVIYSGSIVPINNGSFAIIGEKKEFLSDLENRFKYGISYI